MPCQNITPVTVLPNFDGLPCQGTERFMSPICLVLQTGGWVRPDKGGAPLATPTHTITDPFPRYLFTRTVYVLCDTSLFQVIGPIALKVGRESRQQLWGQSSDGRRAGGRRETQAWIQNVKVAMRHLGFCCGCGHWHGSTRWFYVLNVHYNLYCIL